MQISKKFEEQIKEEMLKKAAEVYPSLDMFSHIKNKIEGEKERGNSMNIVKTKKSRGVLVACIVLILTTATCFAAIKIGSYSSYSSNSDFTSYPSESEMKKKVGFSPDYVEGFSNEFNFKNGGIGEATSNDESGNAIETVKTVSFTYENNGKQVFLQVENGNLSGEDLSTGEGTVEITKNIKGRYTENMYKFLPSNYVLTEQDKIDEANGTYIFSYGSKEVEISHVQNVSWIKDGMKYAIMSMDDGVTKEELINMAAEVLEGK